MAGLLAVPICVLFLVLVLALVGGRWRAPAPPDEFMPADEPQEDPDDFELWTEPAPHELPAARDDHGYQAELPAGRHAYGSLARYVPPPQTSRAASEQQSYWPPARESYAPAAQDGNQAPVRDEWGYGYATERSHGSTRKDALSGYEGTSNQDAYPARDTYDRPDEDDPGPAQPTRFPYGPYKP